MTSQQVIDLARLGQKVQEYYGGFPQDIEWAIEAGALYLLQSRPITGVDFTWDADVDLGHLQPVAVDHGVDPRLRGRNHDRVARGPAVRVPDPAVLQ